MKSFLLYTPKLLKLISENKIENIDFDIFDSKIKDKFTFLRYMNILNLSYFPRHMIKKALKIAYRSLKDGGIIQIGNTNKHSFINIVGFYRKNKNNFNLIYEFNGGTELKDLIKETNFKE